MKRHQRRGSRAFTLTEVLVIGVVLALAVALFLPALLRPRRSPSRVSCVNNLKQIALGFRIWSGDNGDRFPMHISVTNGGTMELVSRGNCFPHFLVMSNELNTPKILVCPWDSKRTATRMFDTNLTDANIGYFVGVDADITRTNMWLVGDRNLTLDGKPIQRRLISLSTNSPLGWTKEMHVSRGNIALADGSVVWNQTASQLGELLRRSGATNRLAVP